MALPTLNNTNTIAQIDGSSISEAVLASAARSGRLNIYNNGSINFNNNITGSFSQTATKVSSNELSSLESLRVLYEIRNAITSLSENIVNFISNLTKQNQIFQNQLEASAVKQELGSESQSFAPTSITRQESQSSPYDNMSAQMQKNFSDGGFAAKLLSTISGIGKFLLKGFGLAAIGFLGYKLGKFIANFPVGNGKTLKDKLEEYVKDATTGMSKSLDDDEEIEPEDNYSSETSSSSPTSSENQTSTQTNSNPESATREESNTETSQIKGKITRTKSLNKPKRNSSGEIDGLIFAHPHQRKIKDSIASIVLELQNKLGKKFLIQSGHRTSEDNKNGAKNSAHLRGYAVDLYWEGGKQLSKDDYLKIIPLASSMGALGIGIYDPGHKWIHLDTDPKLGRRAWGPDATRKSVPKWAEDVIRKHLNNEHSGNIEYVEESTIEDEKEPDSSNQLNPSQEVKENVGASSSEVNPKEPDSSNQLNPSQEVKENVGASSSKVKPKETDSVERVSEESYVEEEEEEEETAEKTIQPKTQNKQSATKENKNTSSGKSQNNAKVAYEFFKGKGFSEIQSSAIVGNLQQESGEGLNYNMTNSIGAYGIAQWTPKTLKNGKKGSARLERLKKQRPNDWNTLNGQLEYVWWELNNSEYKSVKPAMMNASTIEEATNIWTGSYEIPNKNEAAIPRRVSLAKNIYSTLGDKELAKTDTTDSGGKAAKPKEENESSKKTADEEIKDPNSTIEQLMHLDIGAIARSGFGAAINQVQLLGGAEPTSMVKLDRYKDEKTGKIKTRVIPYKFKDEEQETLNEENLDVSKKSLNYEDTTASEDLDSIIVNKARKFFGVNDDKASPVYNSTPIEGEQIYQASKQNKEYEWNRNESGEETTNPIVINNNTQSSQNSTQGLANPPQVRNSDDSTLERMQYNSIWNTGHV